MASVIITSPYRAWYMLALLGCLVPTGLAQTLAPSFQGYEIIPGSEFSSTNLHSGHFLTDQGI